MSVNLSPLKMNMQLKWHYVDLVICSGVAITGAVDKLRVS